MSSGGETPNEEPVVDPALVAGRHETVAALVTGVRKGRATPIRRAFVQPTDRAAQPAGGPLASLVAHRDTRGLLLYLLVLTLASDKPYNVRRNSAVWARALGLDPTRSGRESVSKTWQRLRAAQLVTARRTDRYADITPLREDGSGEAYTYPEPAKGDRYLRLPIEFWTDEWYATLGLPGIAMLLVLLAEKPDVVLPIDRIPDWYGLSRTTAKRGFDDLQAHGLLRTVITQRREPLSPLGYTFDHHRVLMGPFARPVKTSKTSTTADPAAAPGTEAVVEERAVTPRRPASASQRRKERRRRQRSSVDTRGEVNT